MKRLILSAASLCLVLTSGCFSVPRPSKIAPIPYDSALLDNLSCQQLGLRFSENRSVLGTLEAEQEQRVKDSKVMTGVAAATAIFGGAGAYIATPGGKETAKKIGELRGQQIAIEERAAAEQCALPPAAEQASPQA